MVQNALNFKNINRIHRSRKVEVGRGQWRSSRAILLQGQPELVAQDTVQLYFYFKGWRRHNLSGPPVPGFNHPHSKKKKVFSHV